MARTKKDVRTDLNGAVIISGSFAPAGTGAVTDVYGAGFTVARTAAGVNTITLTQPYNRLVGAVATVQLASSADTVAQFGSYDATAKTLVLRTLTAGSDADIAANANNRVHFTLMFRDSGVN